ncbi:MAG: sortase [Patescibacteria group bacterium]
MALDLFTKEEIWMAKKIAKYGFILLIATGIITSLIRVTLVYITDGQTGLQNLIKKEAKTEQTNAPEQNLKDTLLVKKETQALPTQVVAGKVEAPLSLEVPTLGIKTVIESPETTNVDTLDSALSRSAVYYQGSGTPGSGNMLIFGHSTGFKIVRNQAYKVFNNLKLAKVGAYIYVKTASGTHTYKVRGVKHVSKYDTWINFQSNTSMLTLATCDSFGKSSDRWILEADYVGFTGN